MFNEEIDALVSFTQQQNHLKMLLQIREQVTLTPDYKLYLDKVILQDVHDYLDNYGGELKELN
jgi:hypothetical protein